MVAGADADVVAGQRGEVGEQVGEGVQLVAVSVWWLVVLAVAVGDGWAGATGSVGAVGCRRCRAAARAGGELELDVVGEHAQEGVGAHAVFEVVVDRADLERVS